MVTPAPGKQMQQRRRKSRAGCRNCKLRKLKCDETRPQCKKCTTYGVFCNFRFNVADLQPRIEEPTRQVTKRDTTGSPRPPICSALWTADTSTSFTIDEKCRDLLHFFKAQSIYSRDDSISAESKSQLVKLAFTYPFLMHGILALTAIRERFLSIASTSRRTLLESYHWSRCTALFNKRLGLPIEPGVRDALWGTASALGIIAFSSLDAIAPEESWPLKAADPSDLEWIRLGDGKMALWHIVDPLRPDSLFHVLASTFAQMHSPLQAAGIDRVPIALARLCNLDESSTAESNPYFKVVHALSQLQALPTEQLATGRELLFLRHIEPSFKPLLQKKDPVALLILYLWYCRARRTLWWIELRARVECAAISLYLQRYHKENAAVQALLPRNESHGNEGCGSHFGLGTPS